MTAVDVTLLEPGMSAWVLDADRTDADMAQVRGGTIIGIDRTVDADTGELTTKVTTATAWRGSVRYDTFDASEIRTVDLMNTATVRGLIRAAAGIVASSKRSYTSDVAKAIDLQAQLARVLG